jgi:hypothetical protein
MKLSDYFLHPLRLPQNAEGPFYTIGGRDRDGVWCGNCLECGLPEDAAPGLLAPLNGWNPGTHFVRQPKNEAEIEQACRAIEVCCVDALRYGGRDPKIIQRLGGNCCDFAESGGSFGSET